MPSDSVTPTPSCLSWSSPEPGGVSEKWALDGAGILFLGAISGLVKLFLMSLSTFEGGGSIGQVLWPLGICEAYFGYLLLMAKCKN